MNYTVIWTSRFKKDYKLLMKRGADMSLLDDVIRLLSSGETLPEQYRDHDRQLFGLPGMSYQAGLAVNLFFKQ